MKRISLILCWILCVPLLGVGANRITVYTTIHPFKCILAELIGERGEVYTLLPPGASPHTYEIKPSDQRTLQQAEALFYGAENLDGWVLRIPHPHKIALMNLLPDSFRLKWKANEHGHDGDYDPHFWTDPLAVKALLPALCEKLISLDPAGEMVYRNNLDEFGKQVDILNAAIKARLEKLAGRGVLLAQPFFRYFLQRYQLRVLAVIEQTPGVQPTPREMSRFIRMLSGEQNAVILTQQQLSDRPARLVSEGTGARLIRLDPIGGRSGRFTYRELLLYNTSEIIKGVME